MNLFLLSCVHKRNWESTNFNLIPRGFSATFRLRAKARIFSSFQLLSIVLSYKLNSIFSFFSACPGLIFIGEQWKKKETKR